MMITPTLKDASLLTAVATCSLAAFVSTGSPVLYTDPAATNTLIFRDYNSGSDTNVSFGPASQSFSGGVSTWTYSGSAGDPKIIYNDGGGAWDHAAYPWVRARYQHSRTNGGALQVWEQNAAAGQFVAFSPSLALVEATGNPTNPSPSGAGFRMDPFGSALNGDSLSVDYVMIDRYETVGLAEWDKAGDAQGWSTPNNTGIAVSNGVLSGTTNGDSQVTNGTAFDANKYKFIQIRMKASGNSAQLFWANNNGYTGTQVISLGANDGNFHTYLIDFSGESTWTGANMNVRLDPAAGVGTTFEIDYIRASANALVPEPSSLALLGLGACMLANRRRRRSV